MNVGEMQRLLSLKAAREPDHKFDDLHSLLCDRDWLRLAHAYVEQNAGSKTAGCDGIDMDSFNQDLGNNLRALREELKAGTFTRPRRGSTGKSCSTTILGGGKKGCGPAGRTSAGKRWSATTTPAGSASSR
jgi:hypothetical protein